MRLFTLLVTLFTLFLIADAQTPHHFIIVDQFGYLPDASKIAVIKNPQTGFDSDEEYIPGKDFALVDAKTHEQVFKGTALAWKNGKTDASSGDKVWHFNFSEYAETGTYYVLDIENNYRSYKFQISPSVYNEILKQAVRAFFYQRAGFAKDAEYAGEEWADGASHIGNLQDKNARYYAEKSNAAKERDVSGGWYDAGDYNKYTNWTADYVVDMMLAYLERPEAWGDDYNIPESGNGIPDLLDEAKWGIDHLLRLQNNDGSMISIVGLAHASPPSSANMPSYYGSPNTSSALTSAGAFAISSKVFRNIGMDTYADSLLIAAEKAWDWAIENPNVIFRNNDSSQGTSGLGAGQQEVEDYGRITKKLRAAVYLFEVTGKSDYQTFFDNNYTDVNMFQWNFAFPFQTANQEMVLYYANLNGATPDVASNIRNIYRNAMRNGSENFPAISNVSDPYMAHIKDYTWGSNSIKCRQGLMYYVLSDYNVDPDMSSNAIEAAREYIHYIHGRNPLNMVYLSNMYHYGGENCVNEFYHSWFTNGSAKWDRVGESLYGPAPGFLVGGPNPSYDWDRCCPGGCGSAGNNQLCYSESIEPPLNQPDQKSYKDFNTSWPLNSWSVTENSNGYQISYIRLLSKFVNPDYDCNGDFNGTASIDACGICSGGNTGIEPELNPGDCNFDCYGDQNGEAFVDSCAICAGGNTNNEPITDTDKCNTTDPNSLQIKKLNNINIFPNPANEFLSINISCTRSNLRLFNNSGKLYLETCLDYENSIDISDLTPGIYIIKVITKDGTYTQRILKK